MDSGHPWSSGLRPALHASKMAVLPCCQTLCSGSNTILSISKRATSLPFWILAEREGWTRAIHGPRGYAPRCARQNWQSCQFFEPSVRGYRTHFVQRRIFMLCYIKFYFSPNVPKIPLLFLGQ
jgi:hypothetical protein